MSKWLDLLLVDDNPGDLHLTQEALKQGQIFVNKSVVNDGIAALAFLRREGKYENEARPDLIILDLNLPKMDGRELLAEIKADDDLKRIPVIILTSSKAEEDVVKTYNLHANCYIFKPVDMNQYITIVKAIEAFWMTVVKFPPKGKRPFSR